MTPTNVLVYFCIYCQVFCFYIRLLQHHYPISSIIGCGLVVKLFSQRLVHQEKQAISDYFSVNLISSFIHLMKKFYKKKFHVAQHSAHELNSRRISLCMQYASATGIINGIKQMNTHNYIYCWNNNNTNISSAWYVW